ncbi:hypothetical protein [Raineya sp.]|jgi:hypothetical protein
MKGINFKDIVQKIEVLKNCYQNGLQALGNHSVSIQVENTRLCEGSIDLDNCLKEIYPSENRWDYVVGYENKSYFIEVHPADTSDVKVIIKKAEWLKKLLDNEAKNLKAISHQVFYWIATSGVKLKGNKYQKQLAQSKIVIVKVLKLPVS